MDEYLELMLDFAKEAGKIALIGQENLEKKVKKDKSIVTNIDVEISNLFHKRIEKYLISGKHKILDEENLISKEELFDNKTEFLWTIDPIDGTNTYFHGFPTWAIAIGLYKNFEPYLGVVYLPVFNELIYTNSTKSYLLKNAFLENEKLIELKLNQDDLMNDSIIMAHKIENINMNKFKVLDFYSTYVLAFYTIVGKSKGTFFSKSASLWDISASIPIWKNMGLICKDIKNDKVINSLRDISLDKNWKIKDLLLLCNNIDYEELKTIIKN